VPLATSNYDDDDATVYVYSTAAYSTTTPASNKECCFSISNAAAANSNMPNTPAVTLSRTASDLAMDAMICEDGGNTNYNVNYNPEIDYDGVFKCFDESQAGGNSSSITPDDDNEEESMPEWANDAPLEEWQMGADDNNVSAAQGLGWLLPVWIAMLVACAAAVVCSGRLLAAAALVLQPCRMMTCHLCCTAAAVWQRPGGGSWQNFLRATGS
jgi:hypothetical protein